MESITMIAIEITDLKNFMNTLLLKETFDTFYLEEATLKTAQTFVIDGHLNKDFYTKEELENSQLTNQEFSSYGSLRPFIFSLVKGNHTPLYFKFVLHTSTIYIQKLLQKNNLTPEELQLKSLVLNIKYDGTKLICTTGTAYHTFVMDKTVDTIWDKALKASFSSMGITFEEL